MKEQKKSSWGAAMVSFFKEYLFNFSGPGHLYYDENLTNEGKRKKNYIWNKEHFAAVGIAEDKPYITDEDKMGIIGNLTVRMKTIIRRDFLVANFKGAYGNNTVATLLLDFARRHMPEELANIEREYNGVYEKRHQRIEEKKAVLLVQERARERKVTQPEEEPQTEEIAA